MADDADEDDDVALPPETTEEALDERHACEVEELDERARKHLEAAKAAGLKGKKGKERLEAVDREVEQWRYELAKRHKAEAEKLAGHLAGNDGAPPATTEVPASVGSPMATEEERINQKREKALRKRQGRAAREAEREAAKEREKQEAGPSARELELAALAVQLAKCKPPLRMLEVAADGNCLYWAVADQLRRVRPELRGWQGSADGAYQEMRSLCATALRRHPDNYSPFAELKDGETFEGYCDRVEHSADWGGELELRALADELGARILVHRAGEVKPLTLGGDADTGLPLQLIYHRHYYALGEHYNSAVPLESV